MKKIILILFHHIGTAYVNGQSISSKVRRTPLLEKSAGSRKIDVGFISASDIITLSFLSHSLTDEDIELLNEHWNSLTNK